MKNKITFAGGPTHLPEYLTNSLQQKIKSSSMQNSIIDSYLHINSQHKQFQEIAEKTRSNLRNILNIPSSFEIWFLGCGVHTQFAQLPMNFSNNINTVVNYASTGYFSKMACQEAKKYCNVNIFATKTKDQFGLLTLPNVYNLDANAVYTFFVENQTVEGLEYPFEKFPILGEIPLVNDCSSSFLTRPINWEYNDIILAHGQKNCGITGSTIMIVNSDIIEKKLKNQNFLLSQNCNYKKYKQCKGCPFEMNILPIYSNYLISQHILNEAPINQNSYEQRAKLIYNVLDKYSIYQPIVNKKYRSRINVTWMINDPIISEKCIKQGEENGLYEFKGHRMMGGFRASLYLNIPDQAVKKLSDFLIQFGQKH